MRVAVVGARIMGAATVYQLAQHLAQHPAHPGIEVHLFDFAPGPAEGVTHNSFGWINTINGDPSFDEAYQLRVKAVEEYELIFAGMPELIPHLRRGSLVWSGTPEATASHAAAHRADEGFELTDGSSIAGKEPRLKKLPDLAIYSPRDIAISPAVLAGSFITRAERSGTVLHCGTCVHRIELTGQSVAAIQTDAGRFRCDLVVLAAGTHTGRFLADMGMSLAIASSPVVLLRYRTNERFIRNTLSFPELEARQAVDQTVLVVEDFHPGCEEMDFKLLRLRVADVLHEFFVVPEDFEFSHGAVVYRPMFPDGLPRRGFVQNVEGLYLLVGHPGIILAPLLSRLAAEEIVGHYS